MFNVEKFKKEVKVILIEDFKSSGENLNDYVEMLFENDELDYSVFDVVFENVDIEEYEEFDYEKIIKECFIEMFVK